MPNLRRFYNFNFQLLSAKIVDVFPPKKFRLYFVFVEVKSAVPIHWGKFLRDEKKHY